MSFCSFTSIGDCELRDNLFVVGLKVRCLLKNKLRNVNIWKFLREFDSIIIKRVSFKNINLVWRKNNLSRVNRVIMLEHLRFFFTYILQWSSWTFTKNLFIEADKKKSSSNCHRIWTNMIQTDKEIEKTIWRIFIFNNAF